MPFAPKTHRPQQFGTKADNEKQWASRQADYRDWYNTTEWRRLRDWIRIRDGWLCQECGEPVSKGDGTAHVDHKIPHRGRDELFWDEDNLWLLCAGCHSRKTQAEGRPPLQNRIGIVNDKTE